MGLSIKNPETEALARQVAAITGESLTEAIHNSLAERQSLLKHNREKTRLLEELMHLAKESARHQTGSGLTDDEILGYDEVGAPTR